MKSFIVFFCALLAASAYALDPIKCDEGTTLTGDAPPQGTQQQCALPDGTPQGEQRVWYHDGKLMEQRHFDHGREHGEQKAWWPNGTLMMQGVSIQGKRYGGYKYWDVAGNLTKIETATVQETSLPDVDQKPADTKTDDKALSSEQNKEAQAKESESKDKEPESKPPESKPPENKKVEDEEPEDDSEPLQDAIDQSQLKDVAPLPPASIP
jgi:hypothetical protein